MISAIGHGRESGHILLAEKGHAGTVPVIRSSLPMAYSGFCAPVPLGWTFRKRIEIGRTCIAGSTGGVTRELGKRFWMPWWMTQTLNCTIAAQLIKGLQAEYLLEDRGYDTDAIILKAVDRALHRSFQQRKFESICGNATNISTTPAILLRILSCFSTKWRGIATRYAKNTASCTATVQTRRTPI
ncbi:hypothetical protein N510_000653 [Firmicutes bacterium ASF500]|nr:hypothetical protein N510_000653 [Firmicutes bacterium ASF500]